MTETAPTESPVIVEEIGQIEEQSTEAANSAEQPELSFEERMDAVLKESPRTIKVNGKEKQLRSWAELERYASREMAAEERFQEAKRIKEEADELRKAVESGDLLALLKKRGLDQDGIKKTLGDVVQRLIEEEEMDPRDRKIREYEERERLAKEAEENKKREAEEKARMVQVETKAKEYVEQISDAAERLGLVADPYLLGLVANELKSAYDEGVEMSVDSAVRLVRDNFVGQYADYVKRLPLALKKEIFGEDALKELQEASLARAKSGSPTSKPADARQDSAQAEDDEDPLSADAFHARRKPAPQRESQKDFFKRLQLGDF